MLTWNVVSTATNHGLLTPMPFLIDGYNLLFALGLASKRTERKAFDRARADLLDWIRAAHGDGVGAVTVVLDGQHVPAGRPAVTLDRGLRVRLAVGQLADDVIEELIRREPHPRRLTVVSSDHRVQAAARRRDCIVWDISDYVDWVLDRGHAPPKPPAAPAKPADASPEEQEHWLQAFGDLDADPELRKFNRPYREFDDR